MDKSNYYKLFEFFKLIILGIIQKFLKYKINYSLLNLNTNRVQLLLHFFKIDNINNIMKNIIVDTFFDNLVYCFNKYIIVLCFLFLYYF